MFEGLWYRCTFCDLKTCLHRFDSPATYVTPNMGWFVFVFLELFLFVAGSFSLGGEPQGPTPGSFSLGGGPQGPTPGSFSLGGEPQGPTPGSFSLGGGPQGPTPGSFSLGGEPQGPTPGSF